MGKNLTILSWNVNGVRAAIKKSFFDFLRNEAPDILCLQETKLSESALQNENLEFPGYLAFWNPASKPGYSGTAILISKSRLGHAGLKDDPAVSRGFGGAKFEDEGRIQVLELGGFFLVNAYFPNANHALSRLGYKLEFNAYMLDNIKNLEKAKPVVLCGDYNVAHNEIDIARPKENVGNAGFTYEERQWMDRFLGSGFADTYRALNGDRIQYSWWSYRSGARARNIGWRIDYFCVSSDYLKKTKRSFIMDQIMGSDHCPVGVELIP